MTPGENLRVEAGAIRAGFSLPSMARAGLAISRAEKGTRLPSDIKGAITLFQGRISANVNSNSLVLLNNLTAILKVDDLDKPWPLSISGKTSLEEGAMTITGLVQVLSNGVFEPDAVKGNITLNIENLDVAPIISMLPANESLPNIAGHLNCTLTTDMEGMNNVNAKGEVALASLQVTGSNIQGVIQTLGSLNLKIDANRKGPEVSVKTLDLDGSLIKASMSGDITLTSSNTISTANMKVTGKINLANIMALLPKQLVAPTSPIASGDTKGTLAVAGKIQVDMLDNAHLLDALTIRGTVELNDVDIAPIIAIAGKDKSLPEIEGRFGGKIKVGFDGIEALEGKGTVFVKSLRMAGGIFGQDTPSVDTAKLSIDLVKAGKKVKINTCSLNSPLFDADISGDAELLAPERLPPVNLSIFAKLNAAEVAHQFPNTLNLQKGLTFSQGAIDISVQCKTDKEKALIEAKLRTVGLKAQKRGRKIQLDKPIVLSAKAAIGKNDIQIDSFELGSSLLSAKGSGNMEKMQVALNADLAAALNEAAKFIDLNGKSGSGQLSVDMSLKSRDLLQTELSVKSRLSHLSVAGFTDRPIHLDQVRMDLDAVANLNEKKQLKDITKVMLSIQSDPISVRLKGEHFIPDSRGMPTVQRLELNAESDLAQLVKFVRSIKDIPADMVITGKAKATSHCSLREGILSVPEFDITLSPFSFRRSDGLTIDNKLSAGGKLIVPIGARPAKKRLHGTDVDSMLSVQSAKYLGIRISNVKVPLRIKNEHINLNIESSVNQGKVMVPIHVDAGKEPPVLDIPDNTRILRDIKLTNEMIDQLVVFVSPLLKGCVVSSGSLSALLRRCRIPLGQGNEDQMDFAGICSFRSVTLNPAELLHDILSLAELQDEKVVIPDQDIQSVLRNGRLHSSELILVAGGYEIRISGSVGLDKTLDYLISIPITQKMVGKDGYKYLKGECIPLPISGTVKKPRFDAKAFLAEVTKAAGRAGGRKLIEEGQKLLLDWLKK